jgi:hypothetical protein
MSKSWRKIVVEIECVRRGSIDQGRPGRAHSAGCSEREALPQAIFGYHVDDGTGRNVIHSGDHTRRDIQERAFTATVGRRTEVASTGRPFGQCPNCWFSLVAHLRGSLRRHRVHRRSHPALLPVIEVDLGQRDRHRQETKWSRMMNFSYNRMTADGL